jgi:hypothetical protein
MLLRQLLLELPEMGTSTSHFLSCHWLGFCQDVLNMRHGKDVKISGPFERGPGKSVVLPPSILVSKMDNTKSKSVASFEDVLAIPWAACIALLVRLSDDLSPGDSSHVEHLRGKVEARLWSRILNFKLAHWQAEMFDNEAMRRSEF